MSPPWFFENRYYNRSDHRTAGAITLDAVFPGAGNPHYFSAHLDEGLDPHDVDRVWLAWTLEPNHREDVTGHLETKLAALAREAEEAGRSIDARHAEAFRVLDLSRS